MNLCCCFGDINHYFPLVFCFFLNYQPILPKKWQFTVSQKQLGINPVDDLYFFKSDIDNLDGSV